MFFDCLISNVLLAVRQGWKSRSRPMDALLGNVFCRRLTGLLGHSLRDPALVPVPRVYAPRRTSRTCTQRLPPLDAADGDSVGDDSPVNSPSRTPWEPGCQGSDSSEVSVPEPHWRTSCRNTRAFIGIAESEISRIRRRGSSPEHEGDSTNSTASRECVPIR
jgi:hypothetical protein